MSERCSLRGPRRTEGDHDVRDARVIGRAERGGRAGTSTTRLPPAWGARGGRGRDSGGGHRRRHVLRRAGTPGEQPERPEPRTGDRGAPATTTALADRRGEPGRGGAGGGARHGGDAGVRGRPRQRPAGCSGAQRALALAGASRSTTRWCGPRAGSSPARRRASWRSGTPTTPRRASTATAPSAARATGPGGSMRSTTPSRGTTSCLHQGTTIELQTTRPAEGVGISATVDSVWSPGASARVVRPGRDVDRRHARSTVATGGTCQRPRRSFTITDPDRVLRATVAFDALRVRRAVRADQLPVDARHLPGSTRLPHQDRRPGRRGGYQLPVVTLGVQPRRAAGRSGCWRNPTACSRCSVSITDDERVHPGDIPDAPGHARRKGGADDHLTRPGGSEPDTPVGPRDPRDRGDRDTGARVPLRAARPRGQPDRRTDRCGVGAAGHPRSRRGDGDDPGRFAVRAPHPGEPAAPPDHRPHLPRARDGRLRR